MRDLADGLGLYLDGSAPDAACGMHVHIDASDLSVYDLSRLIRLYYKVEKALFDLVNPDRLTNTYARPCGKFYSDKLAAHPRDFRTGLISAMYFNGRSLKPNLQEFSLHNYGVSLEKLSVQKRKALEGEAVAQVRNALNDNKTRKYRDIRYKALNLHSYFLRKTIEFRHHHGTVDYEEIVGWGQVCQELVSFSQRMSSTMGSSSTVNQYIEALPVNSRKSLLAVMPARLHEYIIKAWKRHDGLIQDKNYHRARLTEFFGVRPERYTT